MIHTTIYKLMIIKVKKQFDLRIYATAIFKYSLYDYNIQQLAGHWKLLLMIRRQHCPLLALQYKGPMHIDCAIIVPPAAAPETYSMNFSFQS